MKVLIYCLDDVRQENAIASLSKGLHTLGRGGLLDVKDKRVSRKHAVLSVSEDIATITSVHQNPCFFRAASGKTIKILNNGQSNELLEGDQFSLLPDAFWFQIKIIKHEGDLYEDGHENSLLKRQNESASDSTNSKKSRLVMKSNNGDENNLDKTTEFSSTTKANPNSNEVQICDHYLDSAGTDHEVSQNTELSAIPRTSDINDKQITCKDQPKSDSGPNDTTPGNESTSRDIKDEPQLNNSMENSIMSPFGCENDTSIPENGVKVKQEMNEELKIKKEPTNDTISKQVDSSTSSGSGPSGRRDRCWYGSTCYRRNPNHRDLISHPGDDDYDSDSNDDRLPCPYGIICYRQNLEHRRQYKHATKPAPKPSNFKFAVQVINSCQFCEHCNGKWNRKPDYESDAEDYD